MFVKSRGLTKIITTEDLQKEDETVHDDICSLIQIAFQNSESSQSLKRAYHRRIDEAVKQLHIDDRLVYDLLFSYKKSFIAMFQGEGLTPVFSERDYFDRDIVQKLNKVAEFDIENMDKEIKDKKVLSDIFDYGVGLRVYDGFDKVNKCLSYITPSPLSWYYDPNGSVLGVDFDYHLFERQTSLSDLRYTDALSGGYFGLDDVKTGTYTRSSTNINGRQQRLQNSEDSSNDTVYIYNCFLTLNGHRYFCIIANDLSRIIKRERLLPRTSEERLDGTLVPFKISISNSFIDAYDAWGISYREKTYATQISISKTINAMESKQLRDLGHNAILYDIDRVDNPADFLVKPSGGPLFIPVTGLGQGPITQSVIEDNNNNQAQGYIQQLEYYAENTTSLTGIVRGLSSDAGTLGETEIQMQKSNALFSVDAGTLLHGERMFWINMYYRSLKENLPMIQNKTAILGIDGSDIVVLKNTELKGFNTPYITVKSKRKEAEENSRKVATMQAMLPLLQADPNVSQISKTMYQRELAYLQGLDESFIKTTYAMTPSERHSKEMQNIINLGQKPKNLIIQGLDIETLWIYVNAALDNDVKQEILNLLNIKMITDGLMKAEPQGQGGAMQGVAASMGAQALSSDIKQRQEALPQM